MQYERSSRWTAVQPLVGGSHGSGVTDDRIRRGLRSLGRVGSVRADQSASESDVDSGATSSDQVDDDDDDDNSSTSTTSDRGDDAGDSDSDDDDGGFSSSAAASSSSPASSAASSAASSPRASRHLPYSSPSETDDDDDDGTRSPRRALPGAFLAIVDPHPGDSMRMAPTPWWQTDNLGVLALLIPITGISTMVLTEVLACTHHFDCSREYPTLSYAAEFKPEGYAFTIGMCATALFILGTVVLFHWFLRLRLLDPGCDPVTRAIVHGCLATGVTAAVSLFCLAVFDMGAHHDVHIQSTIVFFITAWMTMILVQVARLRLLREDEISKLNGALQLPGLRPCPRPLATGSIWMSLQRWKRMSILAAYRLGRLFLFTGVGSTTMFGLLYQCVNGAWPNPVGFTAVQEAFFEAFAIVCQLLFMGTLSCELSLLTRVVEYRDYQELERAE